MDTKAQNKVVASQYTNIEVSHASKFFIVVT